MGYFEITAFLTTLTATFAYINYRYLKLPDDGGAHAAEPALFTAARLFHAS
ncbi:hypothetical protein GEOBRER4_n2578 [Citrifermentans bremense]|uniref:Uncharacterized protein n=1 Tax=Citrifermentans bremense TaxID=60035 RepID=A0A7R7FSI2_9BACT|nr:hypothetical protein GEOBRER4_n2578 [Citrifermentans bremense]